MRQRTARRSPVRMLVALVLAVLAERAQASPWEWSAIPAGWRPNVEVTARVEDHAGTSNLVRVDESLSDSDVAARLILEARSGRHGLLLDIAGWSIGSHEEATLPRGFGTVLASASLDLEVVDLAGVYNPRGDGSGLSLLYGARLLRAEQTLVADFSSPFVPDLRYGFSEDLVDVLLGARYVQPFAGRWSVRGRAGVSRGASKLGWDAEAALGVSFDAERHLTALAGYRIVKLKFDARSGSATIDSTIENRGPQVALAVTW